MKLVADHTFFKYMGGEVREVVNELTNVSNFIEQNKVLVLQVYIFKKIFLGEFYASTQREICSL